MRDKDNKLYHKQICLNVLLAVASGVALFLAFPKPGLYPIVWVALVPLLIAIRRASVSGSFWLGMITGYVFMGGLLSWLSIFGFAPWLLLCVIEAVSIAVFAILARLAYRRHKLAFFAIPALWTVMEWTKCLGPYGFLWGNLANSQVKWLPIIQVASFAGPWGISFLIVLINTAVAAVLIERNKVSKRFALIAALLLVATVVGGVISIKRLDNRLKPDKTVAIVQGNVVLTWADARSNGEIYRHYWPMTESIGKSDFVVWPESVLPGDLLSSSYLRHQVGWLAWINHSYMLVGGAHVEPNFEKGSIKDYNAAYLIAPSGVITDTYYKVHLVPFGEFVPGRHVIPFLNDYPIIDHDRSAGEDFHTLHAGKTDIGVMICFESIFPQIAREYCRDGAGLLFVITNDSWFRQTAAASQHYDCSILRAVENRRYLAQSATTGISSVIDPCGRVIATAHVGQQAIVRGSVAVIRERTIYSLFGDWFAYLSVALSFLAIALTIRKPDKTKGHSR